VAVHELERADVLNTGYEISADKHPALIGIDDLTYAQVRRRLAQRSQAGVRLHRERLSYAAAGDWSSAARAPGTNCSVPSRCRVF
jgi:hypothetical protein